MKIKDWFKFILITFFFSTAVLLSINFYPEKSLFFKLSQQWQQKHDQGALKSIDSLLAFLDNSIPYFPSLIRTLWWQQNSIQLLLTLPFIFLLAWSLTKVKLNYFLFLTIIFLIWLLPMEDIIISNWDKFVIKHHFDLWLPWSKKYIWMNGVSHPPVSYTKYDYSWTQEQTTSEARAVVSCLGHYKISVNGRRIYHGPSFAVLPQVYYDTLDIASFIRPGDNTIEIICSYIEGVTHEYPQYPSPGLLVGGKIKDSWFSHNLADRRLWQYSAMRTLQPIRRLFNAGWIESYDLTKTENLVGVPSKINPDYLVLPRPLPLLQYANQVVEKISPTVFDLGKFSTGYLKLQTKLQDSCQLELVWGAILDKNGFPVAYMDQVDTILLPAGETNWEQFSRRSGRYVGFRGDCQTDKIEVSFTRVFNDFVQPPKPAGLNQLDEDIFSMSLNSLSNNVQDHFEDSVERERAMYLGDALAVSRCLLAADGNEKLVKQAITQFSQRQNENGSFPSMAPSGSSQSITSYSLQWPVFLEMYLQKTGDKEFAQQMWPHLLKLMRWAEARESDEGLFYNKFQEPEWGGFIDWTPIHYQYTYLTPLQLWYLQSLEAAINIANTVEEETDKYKNKAAKLRKVLLNLAFDADKNIFYASFDHQQAGGISLITNALAGRLKMFPSQEANDKAITYFNNNLLTETPFSQTWVIDWLLTSGKKDLALSVIRKYWGGMVKEGASSIFEVYKPGVIKPDKYESHSHAWGCGPVFQYGKIIQP